MRKVCTLALTPQTLFNARFALLNTLHRSLRSRASKLYRLLNTVRGMRAFSKKVEIAGLKVDEHLISVVEKEIAPGTGIDAKAFWASFSEAVKEFGPRTKKLLEKRDLLQTQIDKWHQERKGKEVDMVEYKAFLQSIG